MTLFPGCQATNCARAGAYVWVRVPGIRGTVKAIAAQDITSSNVTLLGGYAYPASTPEVKLRQTGRFLKVRPTEETGTALFVFLYEAIASEIKKIYMGGFKPRLPVDRTGLYPEITDEFIAQIHWQNADAVIGGVRVNPTFMDFDWVKPAIAVLSGDGAIATFKRDEVFKVQPVGYGLWLSVIDFPSLLSTGAGPTFANFEAVEPYLEGSASTSSIEDVSAGGGNGIAKSILVDTVQGKVTSATIGYTSSSSYSGRDEDYRGASSATATGETIILPGVTRPCSFSFSSTESILSTSFNHSVYGSVMVNSSRNRAIALHLNGFFSQNSKWYLFNGGSSQAINERPRFGFGLLTGEREIPEVGSYTFTGRTLFSTARIRVGANTLIPNPLTTSLVGTPIVWAVRFDSTSYKCRKAFGRVVSASVTVGDESAGDSISGLTIAIDRVIDAEYDRHATVNGFIYSNSGSVYDLLFGMGAENFNIPAIAGNGLPSFASFGFAININTQAGTGITGFQFPQFNALGYHWSGDKIYIPNSPPPQPIAPATNYVEIWQIRNGNFIKKDTPEKGDRFPLLSNNENFGSICGAYWPQNQ